MDLLINEWKKRPWWMNLMWFFAIYMTFIYLPYDIFTKEVVNAEEVWFGIVFKGWWARLTEPLHWIIYGLGAYGFWRMKSWMHPWAALYVFQVAIAMAVFNLYDPRGMGLLGASITSVIFAIPAIALWRARERFNESSEPSSDSAN